MEELRAALADYYVNPEIIVCLLLTGSRKFGNFTAGSDTDYLGVILGGPLIPVIESTKPRFVPDLPLPVYETEIYENEELNIDITFYEMKKLEQLLQEHRIGILEVYLCRDAEQWVRFGEMPTFNHFSLGCAPQVHYLGGEPQTRSCKETVSNHPHIAFFLGLERGNLDKCRKLTWLAIRYLLFAMQMRDHGVVVDVSVANDLWAEVSVATEFSKYDAMYDRITREFKTGHWYQSFYHHHEVSQASSALLSLIDSPRPTAPFVMRQHIDGALVQLRYEAGEWVTEPADSPVCWKCGAKVTMKQLFWDTFAGHLLRESDQSTSFVFAIVSRRMRFTVRYEEETLFLLATQPPSDLRLFAACGWNVQPEVQEVPYENPLKHAGVDLVYADGSRFLQLLDSFVSCSSSMGFQPFGYGPLNVRGENFAVDKMALVLLGRAEMPLFLRSWPQWEPVVRPTVERYSAMMRHLTAIWNEVQHIDDSKAYAIRIKNCPRFERVLLFDLKRNNLSLSGYFSHRIKALRQIYREYSEST